MKLTEQQIIDLGNKFCSKTEWGISNSDISLFVRELIVLQGVENDNELIDFTNWYLKVIKADSRFEVENQSLIDSFKNGDNPELWHDKYHGNNKGEGEYYQKVYIKSEADLPRDGIYIAHYKAFDIDSPAGTIISNYDHLNSHKRLNWLERIDWYLQPVSLPDKELTVEIIKYNATSYADEKKALIPNFTDYEWSQSFIDYSRGFCDGFGMTMNNNIPDKDAIIQKQDEIIEHLSGMSPDICAECRRFETELENLKKQ